MAETETNLEDEKAFLKCYHYDATALLLCHKRIGYKTAYDTINEVDKWINRELIGRQYNNPKFKDRRVKFVSFLEQDVKNKSHFHLMFRFGVRERRHQLIKVLPSVWGKIWKRGTIGRIQYNAGDIKDDARRERALLRNNNIPHSSFTGDDIYTQIDYYTKQPSVLITYSRHW